MASQRALFTRIAGIYDRLNRRLTFGIDVGWRRRAVKRLAADTVRILDVATGTADLALAAARRLPAAQVVGVDLTPAMLAIGRRKVAAAGLSARIELQEAEADQLPFAAASFDAVMCAFGYRNFPDRDRALAEAHRVLRPGGKLLVLELFRNDRRIAGWLADRWLRFSAPFFAGPRKGDYEYLRTSIRGTCTLDEFVDEARRNGFKLVSKCCFLPSCSCVLLENMVQ